MTSILAGLYPNLVKILRPPARFVETMGGNLERKSQMDEFKYQYIKFRFKFIILLLKTRFYTKKDSNSVEPAEVQSSPGFVQREYSSVEGLSRVFLHSASIVSATPSFSSKYTLFLNKRDFIKKNVFLVISYSVKRS